MKRSDRIADLLARLQQRGDLAQRDALLLVEVYQLSKRLEDAAGDFQIAHVLSLGTGRASIDVAWMGNIQQIAPVKAREIAWLLLEAASHAEAEAGLCRFLTDRLGLEELKVGGILNAFREYRATNPESLIAHEKPTN